MISREFRKIRTSVSPSEFKLTVTNVLYTILLVLLSFSLWAQAGKTDVLQIMDRTTPYYTDSTRKIEFNQQRISVDFHSSAPEVLVHIFRTEFDYGFSVNNKDIYGCDMIFNSFNGMVDFQNSRFLSRTSFNWSVFSKVNFKCLFHEDVYFYLTRFKGFTEFSYTKFLKGALFQYTVFEGPVDFSGTEFSSEVSFKNCEFLNTVVFDGAILPETFNFSYVKRIDRIIDLEHIKLTNDEFCKINLEGTDIRKIKFNYRKFRLYFDPSSLLDRDGKASIYEAVMKNFEENGQLDSYEQVDKEYRKFKDPFLLWCLNILWWDYGYNKALVFVWTLAFIIIFTIINYFSLPYLIGFVYKIENSSINIHPRRLARIWNAFVFTSIVFFKLSLDINKINFSHKTGAAYLILIYTLGLICLAYMANFVLS